MNYEHIRRTFGDWIDEERGGEWRPYEFGLLKKNAPEEAKEAFRIYNLYMRRYLGKLPLIMDDENNILGIDASQNESEWTMRQARIAMILINQGWIPRKWTDLTKDEQELVYNTLFKE